jgi:hypothetical protein
VKRSSKIFYLSGLERLMDSGSRQKDIPVKEENKVCSNCGIIEDNPDKLCLVKLPNAYAYVCEKCYKKQYDRINASKHKISHKQWYDRNRERILQGKIEYRKRPGMKQILAKKQLDKTLRKRIFQRTKRLLSQ